MLLITRCEALPGLGVDDSAVFPALAVLDRLISHTLADG
jgi:hypothetical protein